MQFFKTEKVSEQLVKALTLKSDTREDEKTHGNTLLHHAAGDLDVNLCLAILGVTPHLVEVRNNNNQNPLHILLEAIFVKHPQEYNEALKAKLSGLVMQMLKSSDKSLILKGDHVKSDYFVGLRGEAYLTRQLTVTIPVIKSLLDYYVEGGLHKLVEKAESLKDPNLADFVKGSALGAVMDYLAQQRNKPDFPDRLASLSDILQRRISSYEAEAKEYGEKSRPAAYARVFRVYKGVKQAVEAEIKKSEGFRKMDIEYTDVDAKM